MIRNSFDSVIVDINFDRLVIEFSDIFMSSVAPLQIGKMEEIDVW